ncbi:YceI family protein [Zobellella aerophila]|uniref:YceI family protein n=1 Tax=Zobellella aerophila TaxID=870480 RepID=A0ABP6VEL4_9GAMM
MKRTASLLWSSILLAGPVMAADYKVDDAHSNIAFKVSHMGFSTMLGRFNQFEGSYFFDGDNPAAAKVDLTIQAESVDTNHEPRDKHLRSPDFFDVRQYPTLNFTSTGYEGTKESGKLTGDLTLHGVTKPVTLDVAFVGEGDDPWGGFRNGFNAVGKIKRSEFGMEYGLPGIGDDIELNVFVEGIRQ